MPTARRAVAMFDDRPQTGCQQDLERWRSRVSRASIGVMVSALTVFVAVTAFALPTVVEWLLVIGLAAVVVRWTVLLLAGRCPRCAAVVRLQSRLELPVRCRNCGLKMTQPRRSWPPADG